MSQDANRSAEGAPVAWRRVFEDGTYGVSRGKPRESGAWDAQRWKVEPLYAHPAQNAIPRTCTCGNPEIRDTTNATPQDRRAGDYPPKPLSGAGSPSTPSGESPAGAAFLSAVGDTVRELAEGIVDGDDNPTAARIVARAFLALSDSSETAETSARAKLTVSLNMHNRHSEDARLGLNASQGHVCSARQALEGIKQRADKVMKDCAEWRATPSADVATLDSLADRIETVVNDHLHAATMTEDVGPIRKAQYDLGKIAAEIRSMPSASGEPTHRECLKCGCQIAIWTQAELDEAHKRGLLLAEKLGWNKPTDSRGTPE